MPIVGARVEDRCIDSDTILDVAREQGYFDKYPFPLVSAALQDRDRKEVLISATEITGDAWRRVVLEHQFPYYVDLDRAVSRVLGTWMHEGYALEYSDPRYLVEVRLSTTLAGIELSGQVDVYDLERHALFDLKTTGKVPDKPWHSQLFQLATYIYLLCSNGYGPVEYAQIHYIQRDGKVIKAHEVPFDGAEGWVYDLASTTERLKYGLQILHAGIYEGKVPPITQCKLVFCKYCDVADICKEVE